MVSPAPCGCRSLASSALRYLLLVRRFRQHSAAEPEPPLRSGVLLRHAASPRFSLAGRASCKNRRMAGWDRRSLARAASAPSALPPALPCGQSNWAGTRRGAVTVTERLPAWQEYTWTLRPKEAP